MQEFKINQHAAKYLTHYVGQADWDTHLTRLWDMLQKQYGRMGQKDLKDLMLRQVACTILLPYYDKSKLTEPPENLLFWCSKYHQFKDRDWFDLLTKVYNRDRQIEGWRNQVQSLGIIDPIDYAPMTRQAFNWLYQSAKDSGVVTESNRHSVEKTHQRLVHAYGGVVVCSIFQKEQGKVKRVHSWRTNYFFERLIYDVYSVDQVVKIKQQELQRTNKKLVRQIVSI